jgi:hypothetical protein
MSSFERGVLTTKGTSKYAIRMLRRLVGFSLLVMGFAVQSEAQQGELKYADGNTWAFQCLMGHAGIGQDHKECITDRRFADKSRGAQSFWYSGDLHEVMRSGGFNSIPADPKKVKTVLAKEVAAITFFDPPTPVGYVPSEEWRSQGCSGPPQFKYASCEARKAEITLANGEKISDVYIRFHTLSYMGSGVVGAKNRDEEIRILGDLSIRSIVFSER